MKLFVAKLNRDAVESDLLEWFGAMGGVRSAKVVTDRDTGQASASALSRWKPKKEEKAIAEMNGQEFMGFRMVVKEAEERGSRPRPGGAGGPSRDNGGGGPSGSSFGASRSGGSSGRPSGNSSFGADKKPAKKKKVGRTKPDKYSDGPRQTKMKKPRGGGGAKDWEALTRTIELSQSGKKKERPVPPFFCPALEA